MHSLREVEIEEVEKMLSCKQKCFVCYCRKCNSYEIAEVRDPWRAEWLDADFKVINEILHINYNHRTVNAELKPQNSEPLENCLMENKTPGIDLEAWLKNANRQGLPPTNIKKGSLYYWHPVNRRVAWFDASPARVGLCCVGYPWDSGSALGVRLARRAAP